MKTAYFAGGCFWCIEPTFDSLDGVFSVESGYSGGDEVNPTYEEVKKQLTSHRETIKISYDENKVSYKQLLQIFLNSVDPFDDGGQFIDRGRSYTLAIYYETNEELEISKQLISDLEKEANKKVYISLEVFKAFYLAEEYHQDFYKKNPEAFEKELIESGRKR